MRACCGCVKAATTTQRVCASASGGPLFAALPRNSHLRVLRCWHTGMTAAFFVIWMWLAARLRKASFSQDADGDLKWTSMNRKTAAFGIPLLALVLTIG